MQSGHRSIEPSILYFGTPVVLVSTQNPDGTVNLAPMSSVWWLGWRCMLGLAANSKTAGNLIRTRQCALNLPSVQEAGAVDRLALLTGKYPVPEGKQSRGYRYEARKFEAAGLTPVASETVEPPRVLECPVQMEAVLAGSHKIGADSPWNGMAYAFEVRIQRVHAIAGILMDGHENRIDPDKWRPLIMSFQKFYGLADGEAHGSRLSDIPEQSYRSPDIERSRLA